MSVVRHYWPSERPVCTVTFSNFVQVPAPSFASPRPLCWALTPVNPRHRWVEAVIKSSVVLCMQSMHLRSWVEGRQIQVMSYMPFLLPSRSVAIVQVCDSYLVNWRLCCAVVQTTPPQLPASLLCHSVLTGHTHVLCLQGLAERMRTIADAQHPAAQVGNKTQSRCGTCKGCHVGSASLT
jgi:hypothetical protein